MKKCFLVPCLTVLLLFFSSSYNSIFPKVSPSLEELKTAFIYNFLKFVSWPTQKDFIELCIIGKTSLADYLISLSGQKIRHSFIKVSFKKLNELTTSCQVVFIGDMPPGKKRDVLNLLKDKPILTISDQKDFIKEGGIIELFLKKRKLRFKINYTTAKKNGLQISSRLLRLAEEVL